MLNPPLTFNEVTNKAGVTPEEKTILLKVTVQRLNAKLAAQEGDEHAHRQFEAQIEKELPKLSKRGKRAFLLLILTRTNDGLQPYHPEGDGDDECNEEHATELDS